MDKSALITRSGILLGAVSASAMMVFSFPAMNAAAMTLVSATVPTAVCDQQIYSGSTPSAVVHTGHDVVVGPVRFGDLDPRLVAKIQGSPLLGIKSQMTVGPTRLPRLVVSAKGAKGHVSIVYGQVPSTTTTTAELQTEPNRIVVQAPLSCGLTEAGFVQYGGGFALAQKQCVTLTVSVPGGRVLARKTVPFGSSVGCASRP
ncbi:MAG TPA: hypothetical protein VI462_05115 [Acidimicrobiia bacterium]